MGNCIKIKKIKKKHLNEHLITNHNLYGDHEEEFNNLYSTIETIDTKLKNIETKIDILENNTQQNIKLLSQDIHYINNN